ncbi:hypothetical protein EF847_01010 [Actinobacteria bacterium YIM 96077]|uniref:RING-type E3 ubiquitin transferase n=1 Tax=Phytoactinopolyspora halophila TaxID=1981511 RepID=A0A329R1D5_9ACTN|nr:GIDE domain-containing protein [Phytoactinopolyspora halophila]AYY11510.1 hypothetical protein EF847_01010 [Actinobacteria bacterium YIM 96077]RAW18006.1 hypothetical protein DPM12_03995 [Phytoactinopolyspora halophila]
MSSFSERVSATSSSTGSFSLADNLWLIGVIALAGAAVCGYFVFRQRSLQKEMIETETFSVSEVQDMQSAAADAAGEGYFRQKCEIVGTAQPGPEGPIKSELSETECVWHKHVVTRKYWTTERRRDSNGHYRERQVQRTEKLVERETEEPFVVADETGHIAVRPEGALEDVEKATDRFEPHDESSNQSELAIGSFKLSIPTKQREGTVGYQYEEWILRPGQKLYVLGEATDEPGELMIANTSLISTKDEQTLLRETRSKLRLFSGGAALAAAIGVVIILVDLLG